MILQEYEYRQNGHTYIRGIKKPDKCEKQQYVCGNCANLYNGCKYGEVYRLRGYMLQLNEIKKKWNK